MRGRARTEFWNARPARPPPGQTACGGGRVMLRRLLASGMLSVHDGGPSPGNPNPVLSGSPSPATGPIKAGADSSVGAAPHRPALAYLVQQPGSSPVVKGRSFLKAASGVGAFPRHQSQTPCHARMAQRFQKPFVVVSLLHNPAPSPGVIQS